jgi:predicted Zn-dependent peptidase
MMNNTHTLDRIDAAPGIRLTCVKTDKFKTGRLSLNLIFPLRRETATLNTLMPSVLRRGSKQYPDMESIAAALDNLYGSRVNPAIRVKGEIQSAGFCVGFPDDRYLTGVENLLEETIKLLCGIMVSPDMRDGLLRADYVESERQTLIDNIRASINDKRSYCMLRLHEEMFAEEAFGASLISRESDALAITPETLTAHFEETIANANIEILYCGCAGPERVEAALRPLLRALPERGKRETPKTDVIIHPPAGAPRRFAEELAITQGKLAIGFRLGEAMLEPDYMAMMVFNALYGGSATSKLFVNVREKHALCYHVGSRIEKHKGVMFVSSGVEFANIDAALGEIHAQLDGIRNGDFSEWELTSAKRAVLAIIGTALDSASGLEDMYFDSSVASVPYDPLQLGKAVESVTPRRIVEIASGIETDTVFILTGKSV